MSCDNCDCAFCFLFVFCPKALLYPGDKLLNYDGAVLKIRQPGGYYDISDQGSVSESMSELQVRTKSPPKEKERFAFLVFPTAQGSSGILWLEYCYCDQ